MPAFFEIAIAVSMLSPVHITRLMPAFWQSLIASFTWGRKGSSRPKIPKAVKSYSKTSRSYSVLNLLFKNDNELYSDIERSLYATRIVLYALSANNLTVRSNNPLWLSFNPKVSFSFKRLFGTKTSCEMSYL